VHSRVPSALDPASFAAEHLVDVNITAKGDEDDPVAHAKLRDNYDVQRLLMRKALQADPEHNPVTHFVHCDADSVPIKSFDSACAFIQRLSSGGRHSLVQFCPHAIKTEAGRKVLHMALVKYIHALRSYPGFARDIPLTNWYWSSKFNVFSRAHTETIVADDKFCALMPSYGITNVATHYPMLMLSMHHGNEIVNIPTTFESWTASGDVRVHTEILPEMATSLQFENLIFATGFAVSSDIADRAPGELWSAPIAVDPDTGESAQYTGL
jgi:hypothetical protein